MGKKKNRKEEIKADYVKKNFGGVASYLLNAIGLLLVMLIMSIIVMTIKQSEKPKEVTNVKAVVDIRSIDAVKKSKD